MENDDVFDSVTWETPTISNGYDATLIEAEDINDTPRSGPGFRHLGDDGAVPHEPKWEGYLITQVSDPVKELDGTKDMYVSYQVSAKTNLPIFATPTPSSRRRFQDFVFLRDHLSKDFPACVVPPIPEKHRLEYITGDRFSQEFIERRRQDLSRFVQRLANHPTLQRATLLRDFLESTEWNVKMHQHIAHPPGPDPAPTFLDNISDTLLNAFAKVRKPDERFLETRDSIDKFEDSLTGIERTWGRARARTSANDESLQDLAADYHDMAVSVQGLGFLESGITDPLNHFSNTLLEFSALLRHTTHASTDPFLAHLQSLLAYSQAHKAVLKLRDQKQLDFEELSDYLATVTADRDRLAAMIAGHVTSSGMGIGAYLRDKVDALRGADDDRTRVEKMRKLDSRIKELQDAVTTAHETSDAFNEEVLRENTIFQYAKEVEMKQLLSSLADGQIEMYQAGMEEWDRIIPIIQRIRVDL